jgi:hypothetical protein
LDTAKFPLCVPDHLPTQTALAYHNSFKHL